MPDVVVVGGGIIGAACAFELARRGRIGDPAREGRARGRSLGTEPRVPRHLEGPGAGAARSADPRSGTSRSSRTRRRRCSWTASRSARSPSRSTRTRSRNCARGRRRRAAIGVRVERVDDARRELEPELAPELLEAYRLDEGHRVDPLALTVCLAALARNEGATIRHHLPARRLVRANGRVTGVVTDDGIVEGDVVVLAAGPWSAALARPLGISLPIAAARGWLVHADPGRPLFRHWIQSGARRLLAGAGAGDGDRARTARGLDARVRTRAGDARGLADDPAGARRHRGDRDLARADVRLGHLRPRGPEGGGGPGVAARARARGRAGTRDVVRGPAGLAGRAAADRMGRATGCSSRRVTARRASSSARRARSRWRRSSWGRARRSIRHRSIHAVRRRRRSGDARGVRDADAGPWPSRGTRGTPNAGSRASRTTPSTWSRRIASGTRGEPSSYAFFGAEDPPPMSMTWHHLLVEGDIGVGEYTYRGESTVPRHRDRAAARRPHQPLARVRARVRAPVRGVRRAEPVLGVREPPVPREDLERPLERDAHAGRCRRGRSSSRR